jgi:hypothetical protein
MFLSYRAAVPASIIFADIFTFGTWSGPTVCEVGPGHAARSQGVGRLTDSSSGVRCPETTTLRAHPQPGRCIRRSEKAQGRNQLSWRATLQGRAWFELPRPTGARAGARLSRLRHQCTWTRRELRRGVDPLERVAGVADEHRVLLAPFVERVKNTEKVDGPSLRDESG